MAVTSSYLYDDADAGCVLYRTQTLVLVDKSGRCEYVEITLSSDAISNSYSSSADKSTSVTGMKSSGWNTTKFDFSFT